MPRIKPRTLDLVADGKVINIKTREKQNFELNKALLDPQKFETFASNPAEFASKYKIKIDRELSDQLADRLKGFKSVADVGTLTRPGGSVEATVWAVAAGAYSVASSKIAVAF